MHKHECPVSFEVPKFISPARVKKVKVFFRFNIRLQVSRVSETTLNAKVKANKLSICYLIVPAELFLPQVYPAASPASCPQQLVARCSTQLMYVFMRTCFLLFFFSVSSYCALRLTMAHFISF